MQHKICLIALFAVYIMVSLAETNVDLATFNSGPATGYKMFGASAGSYLGLGGAVPAGDFNGDGIRDFAINAPLDDPLGRENAGVAYIMLGNYAFNTTSSDLLRFTSSATTGVRIFGAQAHDCLGEYMGGGGDVNGDGYDDVLLGARAANPDGVTDAGTVHIIFGHSAMIAAFVDIDLNSLSASVGIRIRGAAANNWLFPCAVIGDMNGDGYDDIMVSGQLESPVSSQEGVVYFIFGRKTFSNINVGTHTWGTSQDFKFIGSTFNGEMGQKVGSAGDFNGDGFDDAWAGQGTTLYVFFGHSNATTFPNVVQSSFVTSATTGFRIAHSTNILFDSRCMLPGDVNNDGIEDLVITTQGPAAANVGVTYVIFGHRGGSFPDIDVTTFSFTTTTGFKISGVVSSGMALTVLAGDVNHDGYLDFVTAVQSADPPGRTDAGIFVVTYGHSNATAYSSITVDAATFVTGPTTGFQIYGPVANKGSELRALVSPGDVNGDGIDDLLICGFQYDYGSRADAGVVYLILGANRSPTVAPSAAPTIKPSARPTSQPSSQPSMQPSTQPSSSALLPIFASPTYRERNGFAFAAVGVDGRAYSWGEAPYGGDSSAVQGWLQGGVAHIATTRFAFAAVLANGSLASWGVVGSVPHPSGSYNVASMVGNEAAFAGVEAGTGRVIALGSKHHGGDVLDNAYCNGYSAQLSSGVRSITASAGAFAAIKTDGSVYAWGSRFSGAGVPSTVLSALVGVKEVVATRSAFAVLLSTNRVVTWGDLTAGGDSSAVNAQLREVFHLTASRSAFVAFKKNTGVVVWGYGKYGGDTSAVAAALASNIVHVSHTYVAMAAVRANGTVVTWGQADSGGDSSAVQGSLRNVVRVYGNAKAFAALTATGGVVTWGRAAYGGTIPSDKATVLSSGVVSIYHTDRAFAALKSNGTLVVWGQARHGGSPSAAVEALLTDVHAVCANDAAFSAIKTDGSVVAWGHEVSVTVAGVQFAAAALAQDVICA